MWNFRREFRAFRAENTEQHKEVRRAIGDLHGRVDDVHGRVNATRKMIYRLAISWLGALVAVLLAALGWFLTRALG